MTDRDPQREARNRQRDRAATVERVLDALDRVAAEYDEFADAEEARVALAAELTRDELFHEAFTDEPE